MPTETTVLINGKPPDFECPTGVHRYGIDAPSYWPLRLTIASFYALTSGVLFALWLSFAKRTLLLYIPSLGSWHLLWLPTAVIVALALLATFHSWYLHSIFVLAHQGWACSCKHIASDLFKLAPIPHHRCRRQCLLSARIPHSQLPNPE
jgi:hypothetical protein